MRDFEIGSGAAPARPCGPSSAWKHRRLPGRAGAAHLGLRASPAASRPSRNCASSRWPSEQSPSMLVITRPDGIIQYANRASAASWGAAPTELIGTRPALLDAAGQPIDYLAEQWRALEGRAVWKRECQLSAPPEPLGGHLGLRAGGGRQPRQVRHQPRVWVLEDVAVHRQALDTLRHAKRLAEEAAEAKTRFLANMSHEIRTPMNAILGLARPQPGRRARAPPARLPRKSRSPPPACWASSMTSSTSQDRGRPVGIEATRFSPTRCSTASSRWSPPGAGKEPPLPRRGAARAAAPAHRRPAAPRAGVDQPAGQTPSSPAGEIRLPGGRPRHRRRRATLTFTASDTGIGMDAKSQAPASSGAFSQADSSMTRRFGGTGLGLAISRHLVELMGGQLGVSSAPGQGSRFVHARLPAAPSQPPPAPRQTGPLRPHAGGGRRSSRHPPAAPADLAHTSEHRPPPPPSTSSAGGSTRAAPTRAAGPGPDPDERPASPGNAPERPGSSPLVTASADEASLPAPTAGPRFPPPPPACATPSPRRWPRRHDRPAPTPAAPRPPRPLAGLHPAGRRQRHQPAHRPRPARAAGRHRPSADNGRLAVDAVDAAGPDAFDLV